MSYATYRSSSSFYPQSDTSTRDTYNGASSQYSNSNQYNYDNQYNSSRYSSSNENSQYSSSLGYQDNTYYGGGYHSGTGAGDPWSTQIAPYRTEHLYDCPTTGQPIHCITCDVTMPSYSSASIHFSSPEHHEKVGLSKSTDELQNPSEKRRKLQELSRTDHINLQCLRCKVNSGSFAGFLSHMTSAKHLKKINNVGREEKKFYIVCAPCDHKLYTTETLNVHVTTEEHVANVTQKIKEQYTDLTEDFSQYYCAPCDKSCNSMSTFEDHCASAKHYKSVKKLFLKDNEAAKAAEAAAAEATTAETAEDAAAEYAQEPPPAHHPIEKAVVIPQPEIYQCKVCDFSSPDKSLIEKHYETPSHKANKLLKKRHDELYRVANVGKRDHQGQYLGEIIPLNSKSGIPCELCDLHFSHDLLLAIHNRGRLHREMKIKMETEHEKVQECQSLSVDVTNPAEPDKKSGHHCEACNVHTNVLTVYIAHVSSKAHRAMMTKLAKSGISQPVPAENKCELRKTALAPPPPKIAFPPPPKIAFPPPPNNTFPPPLPKNTFPPMPMTKHNYPAPQLRKFQTFESEDELRRKQENERKKKKRAADRAATRLRFADYK